MSLAHPPTQETISLRDSAQSALWIFDENLIPTSPAGSCLLKVLETVAGEVPLRLFCNRLQLGHAPYVRKTRIPLPPGPIVLRAVLFTLLSGFAYLFTRRGERCLRLSTQGVFPFCDLSYAHFCHLGFLRDRRSSLGGSLFRRAARLLNHIWGSITERIAFNSARIIVVPSNGLARDIRTAYPKVAAKIHVIANPVNTAFYARPVGFERDALRTELGFSPDDLVLCFCALGNFEHKGLRLVLEAMSSNPASDIKLLVVGGSASEIQQYQKLCSQLGIEGSVHFEGFRSDIRPYLWASDTFVFPSVYEAFSLVCLQAAAAGLPLITTKLYGIEEFMADGLTGWTVSRDRFSVESAIRQAASDRLRNASMGRKAAESVEMFNEDRFRHHWRSLLEGELKNFEAPAISYVK